MLFAHYVGMCLWLGGMVAGMVIMTEPAYRALARVYSAVVGPGALVTVLTGLALTMSLAQRAGSQVMARPGIWVMQVAGLLAGVLVLAVGVPSAARLARIADASDGGPAPPVFHQMRKRVSLVAQITSLLFVVSLLLVVVAR